MVQFGELGEVVEAGGGGGGLLQQHHANRKIGDHGPAHTRLLGEAGQISQLTGREARSADHRVHAVGDRGAGVLIDNRGVGEIHQHGGAALPCRLAGLAKGPFEIAGDRQLQFA